MTVNVTENTSTDQRNATITVSGGEATPVTVSVTQEGKSITYTLSVSPATLEFTYTSGTKDISITSNDSWTVSSNQSWCTVSPASGSKDGTVKITVSANESTSARSATVTITGANSGSKTISVTQSGYEDNDIGRDDYDGDTNLNNK